MKKYINGGRFQYLILIITGTNITHVIIKCSNLKRDAQELRLVTNTFNYIDYMLSNKEHINYAETCVSGACVLRRRQSTVCGPYGTGTLSVRYTARSAQAVCHAS